MAKPESGFKRKDVQWTDFGVNRLIGNETKMTPAAPVTLAKPGRTRGPTYFRAITVTG